MDLLNQWNKDLRNVFVDVEVKKDAQKIDEFRTKSIDLEGLTTERLSDYFNAKDKAPGKYDFEMVVNFWNQYRMEEKRFPVELLPEDEFEALPAPALTGAAAASGISGSLLALLIVIGVLLLGIIIHGGMFAAGNCDGAQLPAGSAVLVHVALAGQSIPLHGG